MATQNFVMTHEEKLLQKIQGLFFFGGGLTGIFQNIFLFNLGDFQTVVVYDCFALSVLFVLYLFSGKLLKRFSSRTLIRAGLAVFVVLNTCFFLLRERAIDFIVPLGLMAGLGHGLFWPGNNLSQYLLTQTHTRNRYFGRLNFWLNIALAIGPIFGGLVIKVFTMTSESIYGYMALFLLVAIIDFYIFLLAFRLPRHTGISFSFTHILNHQRSRGWKIVLTQQFIFGLWDVAFTTISVVLIFLIVKQEVWVGAVKTISAIVFALGSLAAGKILQGQKYAVIPGAAISALGLFLFGLFQNWWGIIAFMTLSSLFQPLVNVATSKSIYDVIDQVKEPWQEKYHFLIERDSVLGIGRILNYVVLLLFFTPENQVTVAKSWILVIPIFPLLIGLLQWWQYRQRYVIPEVSS